MFLTKSWWAHWISERKKVAAQKYQQHIFGMMISYIATTLDIPFYDIGTELVVSILMEKEVLKIQVTEIHEIH